jgi:Kunitz/Bovine pancreatic trypsin inhibitor domain
MLKVIAAVLVILLISISCQKEDENPCEQSPKCSLEPETGVCRAAIPKYYFDKKEGKCKQFIWGGCDGVVPFDTLEECQQCKCSSANEKQ